MTVFPRIRKAIPDDADYLSALAMRSKAYWGYSPEFMESCRSELMVPEQQIHSGDFDYHVAVEGEMISGFYAIKRLLDAEFELEALFVEPERIGHGIGRQLIQHALKELDRKDAETLLIQGDPNTASFYIAAGARQIGVKESGSIPGRDLPLFQIDL
jgi:GNAT superfamily N-acetyltransferase